MFKRKEYKEKQLRYSIRKVSFGAASVAISALYLLMGSAAVSASEVQAVNSDQTTVTNPAAKDNEDKSRIENNGTTTEETNSAVVTLDKTSLTKLIEEIDGKFTSGKYASKTEDSVNKLKTALEAAKTALSNAKTQAELTQAHANLIVATTKLQTKPEEKKEAPVVDTTNGKATVGKKATNTEKASDSNSIANAGSRDERNGKALDANNPFRTGTDAATTDTDPAANQTYTAPAENADLNELKSELLKLPDAVQNNTKIQDMNDLGDQTGVARGEVKEIQEFGGWKAINQPDGTPGKFAIARKTEAGVFPVETVNTVFTNIRNGQARYYDTYVGEQAFDRSKDYMLFLGKVRTRASESEQTFNGKPYQSTGLGGSDSYAIKSFNGIEKTFKAHSPETGSKVKVAFKTGFTGDLNGTKAKYLVEVVYRQNNSEVTAYTYTFAPQPSGTVKNDKGIVTPAKDGTGRAYVRSELNNYTLNKAEVEAKMAEEANKPNGQAGTFTSSDIDLPVGVTEYTVRIKVTDTDRMGMGYQSPLRHYALPVTGLDFSVEQDTRKLAKNLLQRVYDKLKATEAQDIKGKTDETISAYKEQLKNVENLLAGDLKNTQEYKDIVTAVLDGQQALRTDKSKLTASNTKLLDLINETPDPRIGKTPNSITPYDSAKEEAKKAQAEAQNILNQENPNPDEVATAVSKLNEKLAELKAAKAALVDKATEAQKTKLEESAAKLVKASTDGKTQESIDAYEATYNNLKTELDKAIEAAAAIKTAGDNASEHAALKAQEAVDAVQAKLEAAKATLVDKATEEQVAELRKAEAALTPAEESSLAGTKTPASIAEYKKAVEAIQADLTQAKTTAADLVTKAGQDNAKKADAAEAIAKVDALKAKLADATALLKDKANTSDLATAKDALKELAKVENVTDGKTTSTKEAYDAAKREADAAVTAAEDVINNADSTPEQVATALTNVKAKKAALEAAKAALVDKITQDQKDDLANAEENLKLADTTGKTKDSIKAYNDEVAKLSDELAAAKQAAKAIVDKGDNAGELEAYRVQAKINKLKSKLAEAAKLLKEIDKSAAKKEVEDAAKKATDAIVANNDLTSEQKEAAKAKVAEEATKAIAAIEKATTEDDVTTAKESGKLGIEKEAAKAEIEAAKAAKEKAIEANTDLTPEQKAAAKAKVAEEATKATAAIDQAITKDGVATATDAGKLGIEKEAAKAEIEAAKAAKEKAIEANDKLSDSEKQAAKEEAARVADEAKKAIDVATDSAGVDGAKTTGTTAVDAVNPVGKEKALDAIQKATEDKLAEIDRDDKLSDKEKDKAKAEVAKAAIEAVNAINAATDQASVDTKQAEGTKAVSEVNPVGKDKAKAEIEKSLSEKTNAIDANSDLTDEQKAEAKAKIADEAKKAIDAIDKATTTEDVAAAKESGKLAIEKEAAKAEIEAAKAAKDKAIDANPDLTDAEKATAKDRVEEEAEAAKNAIDKATELSDIDKVTETGKDDIKKVTVTSAKEEAKKAIDEALAAKEKAIDARTDLIEEEKEAAKKAAREEAEAAKNAIDKATTLEDINKVLEDGKENIAKINPENLKDKAKKAIDEALAAKEKAIDARTDLLPEEKEAAKKAAREEAEAAKNAIDKATTSEDINKVLEDGKENIANINPVGAKEEAKKAVEEALANKEKEIDESTDLTSEEKVKAKELAREEAKAAKDAIDKATSIEAIEKALRPFLYQIDQDALVFDRPELDIKAALQASITGTVIAERGNVITQAEIIAKLNLPEDITVISIDLPDTTTLGRKFAKVTLRLADGTQATVSVPVEVVEKSEGNHQQNNTQVKPQEVSKPAAEPSKNSEQVEDGKDTPSKAFEEKNSSKQTVLPNTGTTESVVAMIAAAASGLLGLGLAGRRRKDNEEA